MAAYPNMQPKGLPFTSPLHVYAAAATDADRHIGRLLAKLGELGLGENTYVVFSSDNGPEAMEIGNATHSGVGSAGPLRGRKRSLYDGGIRVPLIVRGPGVPAGRASDAVIAGCDFLPTICALTDVNVPASYEGDGEDRSRCLTGEPAARTRLLFWEWRFNVAGHPWNRSPILAVRDGDWKLLLNPDRSRVELYDMAADPGESDNRADTHGEVVERMATAALEWQKTLPAGPIEPSAGSNAYPKPNAIPAARPDAGAARKKQAEARPKSAPATTTKTKGEPRP
jgi:N-acetylgalactosamine-6-sulfatase